MSEVYTLNRIDVPDAPPDYEDHARERHYVPAPCQVACPVGTDAPSYIGLIWEEKWEAAFEAITATNPFSSICGRVCDAPCEPACRRAASDGPLAIRNLKRTVMDRLGKTYKPQPFPVTQKETVGIVGAGPAGLTAAHELAVAGYEVHVYEMSDRPGGMMIWGIPGFRCPENVIREDMDRLFAKCPGIKLHLNTALGKDVTLDELKGRHDAVLLTIGSWWGKPMGIPGEEDERVVDGVSFLRRINAGERPELPAKVVVVGGGDVAMDACRSALRMPGCEKVVIVYRRGEEEIPARKDELEGAHKEGIEFIYNTQQVAVQSRGNGLALTCVRTRAGEPDADGRRRPVVIEGSEHDIECGMVIAAVGQTAACDDLEGHGLMGADRVDTAWETMRTSDPKVFAAGDGAFGGSTIVMAMSHGQRSAYYVKQFLRGVETPLPYRTPFRTRRVPLAQDIMWERFPRQEQEFHGVGENPVDFPEIESGYDLATAKAEAARCYRCDAETGSADYSVLHREDIFSMARTNPLDVNKNRAMLAKRLAPRDNPFPKDRPGSLDDLVFLPANLSRLVIDPYREACNVATDLGGRLDLDRPFLVAGFDDAPQQVWAGLESGLRSGNCPYLGTRDPGAGIAWLQLLTEAGSAPAPSAAAVVYTLDAVSGGTPARATDSQLLGIAVSDADSVEEAVKRALETGCELLLLDGSGGLGRESAPELARTPDLSLLRNAIRTLRAMKREEHIDLVWFGGARSGTDAAKLIGMGAKAIAYGVPVALALGGHITGAHGLDFEADRSDEDRAHAVINLLQAHAGEASMMARCTGKTNLMNLEPEDMRAISIATADATGIPLVGKH